ncbi:von Hippel-Lindau disease tumor suppressor-like isoform X1 [Myxocyprinus asiaticus]|uniref:von Hippel-Lindau disease tumor suppressor-like isoform X1 n=1 Tax=Myxocyprinus asiaticus TaxID=70543 RepID=UPI0022215C95|nr:von Hippel-Lindau disease tumor suppressor-like isoform X1 [Myxocyprinus asiaticus]
MPQESLEVESPLPIIRSHDTRRPASVVFCNRSPRVVKPIWINFRGEPQPYGDMQPFTGRRMTTYFAHPWIFRDAETDDPMLVNKKVMYYLPSLENRQDHIANITLPVFTLRDRCLQVVRRLVRKEDICRLEIARCLQEDLAQKPSLHTDLRRLNQQLRQEIMGE